MVRLSEDLNIEGRRRCGPQRGHHGIVVQRDGSDLIPLPGDQQERHLA
jgi:hypothetical protein